VNVFIPLIPHNPKEALSGFSSSSRFLETWIHIEETEDLLLASKMLLFVYLIRQSF
jgi:hypothetical protein